MCNFGNRGPIQKPTNCKGTSMAKQQRQKLMKEIERIRGGRTLICLLNFDRVSIPYPHICGTFFQEDIKEALFRVLKESVPQESGIDLFFYTSGGNIDAVWPTVSLLREFDRNFEILVPFRCHSAGTLLCLGARKILMTPLAELGPIDPSVTNAYNPRLGPQKRLTPISVEDVRAYKDFLVDQIISCRENAESAEMNLVQQEIKPDTHNTLVQLYPEFLGKFVEQVHPLALGNVYRIQNQIKNLAKKLLAFNPSDKNPDPDKVVEDLVTGFYSHNHGINREEAKTIIGSGKIEYASDELAAAMDRLLREYENNFELRKPFSLDHFLENGRDSLFWDCVEKFKKNESRTMVEEFALQVSKIAAPKLSKTNVLRKVDEATLFVKTGTGEREARIIGGGLLSQEKGLIFLKRRLASVDIPFFQSI